MPVSAAFNNEAARLLQKTAEHRNKLTVSVASEPAGMLLMLNARMACCVLQAAVVQQSCGMRTRNGGGGHQPAEGCQKKKGNKHITMQYLEQGGYFDVPIHVSGTGLFSHACLHSLYSLLPILAA